MISNSRCDGKLAEIFLKLRSRFLTLTAAKCIYVLTANYVGGSVATWINGRASQFYIDILHNIPKYLHWPQRPAGVGAVCRDSFYVCQSSQHRQSSCAVYRTAALPVLAGLADVEGICHTAPNTSGALCLVGPIRGPPPDCEIFAWSSGTFVCSSSKDSDSRDCTSDMTASALQKHFQEPIFLAAAQWRAEMAWNLIKNKSSAA